MKDHAHKPPTVDEHLARRLCALAHPTRLHIMQHLAARPACCCKDVVECLDLAQSTVSQHLKILVEAGLVTYKPERPKSVYRADLDALAGLSTMFSDFVESCRSAEKLSCKDMSVGD
ncbi:ArsR/SmtB family transcription factor [Aliihoeflea sp. PC F10.4]